jgi:energy-coupling factor transport system substrate-specific component
MHCPKRPWLSVRELVTLGLLTALLFGVQVVLAPIPNVEVVSLLIVLYTRRFRWKALLVIYAFVLLQGALYGISLWFVNYLYVWLILWGAAMLLAPMHSLPGWALLLSAYGFLFGILCSFPYLFIGGPAMMWAYILNGIPFDLVHGVGNAAVALALFRPLDGLLNKLT